MSKTGDIVTIKMTDDPNNSDFEYMAHRRGDTQKDMFYVGAYLGFVADNKLRSLSGKTPAGGASENAFIGYATNQQAGDGNGGSGYNIWAWYQLIFIQCMYVLKYKNLNSQSAVGNGITGSQKTVGGTETKGMDWGDKSSWDYHVKLFGIEDMWGNSGQFLTGVWIDSSKIIWTATDNFVANGINYTNRGSHAVSDLNSYMNKIKGTTHLGFLPTTASGSASTYYCDTVLYRANSIIIIAGGGEGDDGIFKSYAEYNYNHSGSWLGSRLMYL